jgi:membrane peptidoglycan carboxypeptidase
MPSTPRRVKRKPAKALSTPLSQRTGLRGHLSRFALSFTPSHFRRYWLSRAGLVRIGKLAGVGALFIVLVFLWYAKDLPSPSKINAKIGLTTTFYARDELTNPGHGTKLYEVHGNEQRVVIDFNQMPDTLKHATVAVEDRNFYKEGAFSFIGTLRAVITDVLHRGYSQGGSTITQQYVKSSLLTNDKSISRKIKELILSIEIGQFYSKDDILKLYLNEIPYGNGAYGVEAACRTYFSKAPANYGNQNCAQHLNLSQSALLAAIPNAPSYYSPYGEHKDDLIYRQHLILDKMAQQGYVTATEAAAAKWTVAQLDTSNTPTAVAARQINQTAAFFSAVQAPNFVYTVQDQLEAKYGASEVEQGGWKVITTLDYNLQQCAQLAIFNPANDSCTPDGKTQVNPNKGNFNYTNLQHSRGSNAALVAADPKTGQVLAMVGSYSFQDSQVNVATSPRQPGSSFKPYVYATLFGKNPQGCATISSTCITYGAGSVLNDTLDQGNQFGTYKPRDFGGSAEVGGPVTIRTALDGSLNIPAVQALQLAGVSQSINTAHTLGITTLNNDPSTYGLSLVLGSGEVTLADHVNAYESFANGGVHYDPSTVLKISDAKGNTIEDNTKPKTPKKALDPQVAYLVANILSDSQARRYVFGSELDIPGHVGAGQAGQGVAVKTGTTEHYNDAWTMGFTPSIVAGVWAGNNDNSPMTSQAADIAAPFWRGFMTAALTGKPMETFTKPSGLQYLSNSAFSKQSTNAQDYFPAWYKGTAIKTIKIDRVSSKLATSCTPPLAIQEVSDTGVTDTDDAHACDDTQPTAQITGLTGGGPYNFAVKVTLGTFGTTKPGVGTAKLDVSFNGQVVSTQQISASGTYQITYSPSSPGSYAVKATVTDTGFYQGSDEQTIVAGGGGSGFNGVSPSTSGSPYSSGAINFSWSDDHNGPYQLYINAKKVGSSNNGTSQSVSLGAGAYNWYVVDSSGAKTATIPFTVQ